MVQKVKDLYVKHEYVILYLFFGAVTTAVNLIVYYPLYNFFGLSATLSNVIAWAIAVLVAFLTNKPIVFKSHDWSANTVVDELWKFVASRIGSGLLETLAVLLFADVLAFNGNVVKIVVSILVIVMNYITSKFFVFKDKK